VIRQDATVSATSSDGNSLLLVEDDEVLRERLARALRDRGLEVTTAADLPSARTAARRDPPELAIVDLKLGSASGLDLVRDLLEIDAATRIVVLTGYGSIATAVDAIKRGAVNYLAKPADADEILAALGVAPGESSTTTSTSGPTAPSLARAEWEHIQRVLSDAAGNVSEAARRLGVHRRSLQRKLNRYPPQK
jgi:two-component system response regulator RegA